MKNDLSLVPTEEMLNELQKRYDLLIAAGLKVTEKKDGQPSAHSYFLRFFPQTFANLGFLTTINEYCKKSFTKDIAKPGFNSDKL